MPVPSEYKGTFDDEIILIDDLIKIVHLKKLMLLYNVVAIDVENYQD